MGMDRIRNDICGESSTYSDSNFADKLRGMITNDLCPEDGSGAIVDDDANRYFCVRDGQRVPVVGEEKPAAGTPPLHPNHEDRGRREIPVDDAVLIEPGDLPEEGDRIWLKGYGCVRYADEEFVATGDDISAVREEGVDVIHWVPADDTVPVTMRTPDGDVTGHAEPAFADTEVDELIQFERIGFVRVDDHGEESVVYYAHP
jgi:glutamyl-tRNA synthetase